MKIYCRYSPFFSFDRVEQPLNYHNSNIIYNPLCTISIIRKLGKHPVKLNKLDNTWHSINQIITVALLCTTGGGKGN